MKDIKKKPDKDFRDKTISGLSWSVFSQGGRQFFQIIIGIILARLLTPDAFGLIGMITVFTGFAKVFTDLGFSAALIHKKDTEPIHLDTVFWLNISFGVVLTGIFSLLAPYIASFYSEPLLIPLIIFVSFDFFIGSFGIIQRMILKKTMDFKSLAILQITTILISGIVAIILALYNYGVWSLAVQSILGTFLGVIILWCMNSWRPAFRFSKKAFNDLWGYSSNLIGFKGFNYWVRNADNLLIGRFLTSSALGIYSKAYRLMLFPLRNISRVIGTVMFPAFSTIQDDKEYIARIYLKMTKAIALLTFPMMMGLLAVSHEFVLVVFGEQWSGMIPVIRLLSIVGMLQSISTLNGNLYQSQGRTDLQFRVGAAIGTLGVAAIVVGIFWGKSVVSVALAYAIFVVIASYPSIRIAVSLIGLSYWDVAKGLLPILISALVMAAAISLFKIVLPKSWDNWALLFVQIFWGGALYIGIIHLFRLQSYIETRKLLKEEFRKRIK